MGVTAKILRIHINGAHPPKILFPSLYPLEHGTNIGVSKLYQKFIENQVVSLDFSMSKPGNSLSTSTRARVFLVKNKTE